MNEVIGQRVNPGTAQRVARLMDTRRSSSNLNIGIPMTDDRRPFLSTRRPHRYEKVRSDVKLQTVHDASGGLCLLYSVSPKDGHYMKLPVGIVGVLNTITAAATTFEGDADQQYERFEGAVSLSDGAIISHAVRLDGTADTIDMSAENRVAKSFVEMVLIVAANKLDDQF